MKPPLVRLRQEQMAIRQDLIDTAVRNGYPAYCAPPIDVYAKDPLAKFKTTRVRKKLIGDPYGSWGKAARAVGLKPVRQRQTEDQRRRAVIHDLLRISARLGYPPRTVCGVKEYREHPDAKFSASWVRVLTKQKNWRLAILNLGLKTGVKHSTLSRERMIELVQKAALELGLPRGGRAPSQTEFKRVTGYTSTAANRYFPGRWRECVTAAGYTPIPSSRPWPAKEST